MYMKVLTFFLSLAITQGLEVSEIIHTSSIPDLRLLALIVIMMTIDLATGITKAVMHGKQRTSKGFRETVKKFIQYGGSILVGMLLIEVTGNTPYSKFLSPYLANFGTGLLMFIIYIESVSILENLILIDSNSPISMYLIKPLWRVLTIQLKNNAIVAHKWSDDGRKKL